MDRKRKSQILLTIWFSIPVLLIAGLMYAVAYSIDHGPAWNPKRVGAGAGDTGGANAIGEFLRGRDREEPEEPEPENSDSKDDSTDDPEHPPD